MLSNVSTEIQILRDHNGLITYKRKWVLYIQRNKTNNITHNKTDKSLPIISTMRRKGSIGATVPDNTFRESHINSVVAESATAVV